MTIRTDRFENPAIRPVLELFAKGDGLVPVFSDSYLICPAFCDVHVHMREPGFSYKETIGNGSRAGNRRYAAQPPHAGRSAGAARVRMP